MPWPTRTDVEFYGKMIGGGVAIIGLCVAIMGLFFTAYQIGEAKNALVSGNEQVIYKESREILKFLTENPDLLHMMQSADVTKFSERDRVRLDAQIGWILNFYNSSLRTGATEVTAEFRKTLTDDFCRMARYPQVSERLKSKQQGQPFFLLSSIRQRDCNV